MSKKFEMNEALKDKIVNVVAKYKETRPKTLHPIFDEVIGSLNQSGTLGESDAYRARYIRDALALSDVNQEEFKEVVEFIDKTYF